MNTYNHRLEFLVVTSATTALTLSLLAAIGDGVGKREICFSPQNKPCAINKTSTIPNPYWIVNQHKTSNPDYNPYAFLYSKNLRIHRKILPDNPNKSNLGFLAILAGSATVYFAGKLKDALNVIRPHYLATQELNEHNASATLRLQKTLTDCAIQSYLGGAIAPQSYLGGAIAPPQQQLQPSIQPSISPIHPSIPDDGWVRGFLGTTCLIWGNQGSGKSWLARYLLKEKSNMGYRLVVLDPNSNAYEWNGVRLINTHTEIEDYMREYVDEVMCRYEEFGRSNISEEQWRCDLWKQGKAISVLCEEVSTYADFIEDKELISKFFKVALTLSRKQEMPVIFVAHNNTQSCLGNIKGLANLIERSQQIQPLATTNPTTRQPISSGKALLKIENSNDWIEVNLPKIDSKIRSFDNSTNSTNVRDSLENLYSKDVLLSEKSKKLLDFLTRTNRSTATIANIQPNFKIDGKRFSSDEIKAWIQELVDGGYGIWEDNVFKLI